MKDKEPIRVVKKCISDRITDIGDLQSSQIVCILKRKG